MLFAEGMLIRRLERENNRIGVNVNILIEDVTKTYHRNSEEFYAVDHIGLDIHDSEFAVIYGKSGSGKSTLINILAGVLSPTEGTVKYDDFRITGETDKKVSEFRNKRIGYIGQGYTLLPKLTVYENISLASDLYGGDSEGINAILEKLGIQHLKDSYPKHLSGGEMRRAAVARALINNPDVVLADEPTGDLDNENTEIVLNIFKKISQDGKTVVMVTHDNEALKYADVIYEMKKGKIYLGGSKE